MIELGECLFCFSLGFDIAYGNFEKAGVSFGSVYEQRIVRYEHRIRIIVAAVEPLLNILPDGIHAHDVFAKIKIVPYSAAEDVFRTI